MCLPQVPEKYPRPRRTGEHQPAVSGNLFNRFIKLWVVLPFHCANTGVGCDICAQRTEFPAEGAVSLRRAGDNDLPALERQAVKPVKAGRQAAHPAYHDDGWTDDFGIRRSLRKFCQCGNHLALTGQRPPFDDGGGHVPFHTGIQQSLADHGQGGYAHQEHKRSICPPQSVKIDFQLCPCLGVTGDDVHGGAVLPMGHRDSCVGGHRQCRGHARHLLKGNAVFLQQLQLLTAPAEQEGVAALQAHNTFTLLCFFQQNLIDLVLWHGVVAGLFAHINFFGILGNHAQNFRADQTVKDHDLRLSQSFQSLSCQQPRIPRACAHQYHIACAHWHSPSFSCRARILPRVSASTMLPVMLPLRWIRSSGLT